MTEQIPDITKEACMQNDAIHYAYHQLNIHKSLYNTLPESLHDEFFEIIRNTFMRGGISGFQIGYVLGQNKAKKELIPIIDYYKKINSTEQPNINSHK